MAKFDAKAATDALITKMSGGGAVDVVDFAPTHAQSLTHIDHVITDPGSAYEAHKISFKSGSGTLGEAYDAAHAHGAQMDSLKSYGATASDAVVANGTAAGKAAHIRSEAVLKANAASHEELVAVRQELVSRISANPKDAGVKAALDALPEAEKKLATFNTHANKAITDQAAKVASQTGVEFKMAGAAVAASAPAAAAGAAGAVAKGATEAEKIAKYTAKETGMFTRMKMNAVENWKSAGTGGKVARGAGTAVGVILGVKGAADLGRFIGVVSPKTDEQGKEIPVDAGTLVKSAAELGGAALALHYSLTHKAPIFKGVH